MHRHLTFRPFVFAGIAAGALIACQAEAPKPKTSSTQDLLAQVEAIEADESALLFQQAKAAAEKDDVKAARSLIEQALGRGAGSVGMGEAEAEIKKAEARIADRERKAEEVRRARETAAAKNPTDSSYTPKQGDTEPRYITVTADGNSFGASITQFRLRRQNADFGSNGEGSYVSIHKPYSGKMGGTYAFSLRREGGGVLLGEKNAICSGSFSISGYKSYVTVTVYENCDTSVNEY